MRTVKDKAYWDRVIAASRLMADNEWRPWFAWYPVSFKQYASRENDYKEAEIEIWWEWVEYNQPYNFDFVRYRLPTSTERNR